MSFYHGGIPGLKVGDAVLPAPPHATDGCPICLARSEGRTYTIGEWREWMSGLLPTLPAHKAATARAALAEIDGVPDAAPLDPATGRPDRVYLTSHLPYARWYAARSRGDLYQVRPIGQLERSPEDTWESWTAPSAVVVKVVECDVRLVRRDRRYLMREWTKRDRLAERTAAS